VGRGNIIERKARGEAVVDKCLVTTPRLMVSRREPRSKPG